MNAQSVATLLTVAGAMAFASMAVADGPPVRPFNPEQVQGDIRVVLLRVDRSTVFSKSGFRSQTNTLIHAIPGFDFTCVVEALGDEPKRNWITPNVEIRVGGKRVFETPENISPGGSSGLSEFTHFSSEDKPQVTNPRRAVVYKAWLRGLRLPAGKIDLELTAGFNEHTEKFVFKDVPLE